MIAGLEDPSEGEIRIGGRVVNDLPPGERDLAMVFQNYGALSAHDGGREHRLSAQGRAASRARSAPAGSAPPPSGSSSATFSTAAPQALSGGQRQRVALGRAIVRTPELFLMDEPLSNLDAKLRVQMRAQIKHLQREIGVTTIYVTHDQVEAMTLADRVAVMAQGSCSRSAHRSRSTTGPATSSSPASSAIPR